MIYGDRAAPTRTPTATAPWPPAATRSSIVSFNHSGRRRRGRARHRRSAPRPGAALGQRRQPAVPRGPDRARPRLRRRRTLVHQGPVRERDPARGARRAGRARRGRLGRRVVLGHRSRAARSAGSMRTRRRSRAARRASTSAPTPAWDDPADDDASRAWVRDGDGAASSPTRSRAGTRTRTPTPARPRRGGSTATPRSPVLPRSSGPGTRTTSSGSTTTSNRRRPEARR